MDHGSSCGSVLQSEEEEVGSALFPFPFGAQVICVCTLRAMVGLVAVAALGFLDINVHFSFGVSANLRCTSSLIIEIIMDRDLVLERYCELITLLVC